MASFSFANSLDDLKQQARLPSTSVSTLKKLSQHKNSEIRQLVASNRKSTENILHSLAFDTDLQVRIMCHKFEYHVQNLFSVSKRCR